MHKPNVAYWDNLISMKVFMVKNLIHRKEIATARESLSAVACRACVFANVEVDRVHVRARATKALKAVGRSEHPLRLNQRPCAKRTVVFLVIKDKS